LRLARRRRFQARCATLPLQCDGALAPLEIFIHGFQIGI
jgi:hypothetical protein